jgi:nicotinamidase-related amidase
MSTALGLLEKMGLVERKPHPTDGRQINMKLTARGITLRRNTKKATYAWLSRAIAELDRQEQTPSVEFHGDIFHPDELMIYKQRVGAFSDNHLELVLRSRRVEHLVFFGIATSGIVLSKLSRAFDLDFRSVVLERSRRGPSKGDGMS